MYYKKFLLTLDQHPIIGILSSWFGSIILFMSIWQIFQYIGFGIGLLIGIITLYEKIKNNYKNIKKDIKRLIK